MAAKKTSGWGGRRAGAGGKRKPQEQKQAHRTVVTLTAKEQQQLARYARARGLAMGTAARELVLWALGRKG